MARTLEKSKIDEIIDYFLNNSVTLKDTALKFNVGIGTLYKYIKIRGVIYDKQRTRKGKKVWNKGLDKFSDKRIATGAKKISEVKSKHRIRSGGYKTIYSDILKKSVRVHDAVWFENTGYWPNSSKGEQIHHIDGDNANNLFSNLYLTNVSEHSKIHKEYEEVFYKLYKEGFLTFDKSKGKIDWNSFETLLKKLKL